MDEINQEAWEGIAKGEFPSNGSIVHVTWSKMKDLKEAPVFIERFKGQFGRECPESKEQLSDWVECLGMEQKKGLLMFMRGETAEFIQTMVHVSTGS